MNDATFESQFITVCADSKIRTNCVLHHSTRRYLVDSVPEGLGLAGAG